MKRYLVALFAFLSISATAKNVDFKLEAVPLPKKYPRPQLCEDVDIS